MAAASALFFAFSALPSSVCAYFNSSRTPTIDILASFFDFIGFGGAGGGLGGAGGGCGPLCVGGFISCCVSCFNHLGVRPKKIS